MNNDKTDQYYFKEIQRYPILNPEEQRDLADRIEMGDEKALKRLIECNLRLVVSEARKIVSRDIPLYDLIQEGNIGLMVAARKFRSSHNTRFSTYAHNWIRQYMMRYIHNKAPMISLPYRKDELIRNIAKEKNYVFQQQGRYPTDEEIAASMNIPLKTVRSVLSVDYSVSSIDVACGSDTTTAIVDLIVDTANAPDKKMMREITTQESLSLLKVLSANERKVIYYRYGFGDGPKTLREISKCLGVSAETVRQMEMRAIRRMRKVVQETHLTKMFTA